MYSKKYPLNDGNSIPSISFGSAYTPGPELIRRMALAIKAGFRHFDTAQGKAYANEPQLGEALRESKLPRSEFFVSTKWSDHLVTTPLEACRSSLEAMKLDHLDLFLIHQPRNCQGDIAGTWKKMEEIKEMGLARSIGVSNFKVDDLKTLLTSCRIKPAVNQIYLSPNNIVSAQPMLDLAAEHAIQIESYWTLRCLTDETPQPVVAVVKENAARRGCTPDQILLAWGRAKNVLVVTSSSSAERIEGYMENAEMRLSLDEVNAIDEAGSKTTGGLPWSGA